MDLDLSSTSNLFPSSHALQGTWRHRHHVAPRDLRVAACVHGGGLLRRAGACPPPLLSPCHSGATAGLKCYPHIPFVARCLRVDPSMCSKHCHLYVCSWTEAKPSCSVFRGSSLRSWFCCDGTQCMRQRLRPDNIRCLAQL